MGLHLVYDDICNSECDIIVNAANGIGFMGGILGWYIKLSGVSENINFATKGKVEREAVVKCLKHYLVGYMPGSVYVTKGYNLNCKHIFHAVTMWLPGTFSTMKTVNKLLLRIKEETRNRNLKSIAIPLLGTGVGHLNPDNVMKLYEEILGTDKNLEVFVYLLKKQRRN